MKYLGSILFLLFVDLRPGFWGRRMSVRGEPAEGGRRMKSQEIKVYREIQRNTDMAMKAIDTLSDKVYDDQLALQISRQSLKYSELHNEAVKALLDARAEPYRGNYLSDIMLKTGIHYNTLLNTSTSHIAEMMIRGSNNGIVDMEKTLKHNEEAGEKTVSLARALIDLEEKNIARLKDYL